MSGPAHRRTRVALLLAAAAAAAAPAFVLRLAAWPEMVVPAYMLTRGGRLYESVIEPYTPVLILLTALAGKLIGFGVPAFRSVTALAAAPLGALVGWGWLGRRPSLSRIAALFALGLPLLAVWTVYLEGPALWPDPFLAPLVLGGGLLLERFELHGNPVDARRASLLFGLAILVKQTSAWILLAALLWTLLSSARGGVAAAARMASWASLPYAVFVAAWGVVYRTTAHVRWTLLVPLSGHSREIGALPDRAALLEALAPYLVVPAILVLSRTLPFVRRSRSPLVALCIGALGMAWPRWGLLHMSGAVGLLVVLALRASRIIAVTARRGRIEARLGILGASGGAALLVVHVAVGFLGGGALLVGNLGGPVHYWEDGFLPDSAALVSRRVPPGGTFLNYLATNDNVYPLTSTLPPERLYVNPAFWFFLNKDDLDARVIGALERRPDTPVLYREPGAEVDRQVRGTRLYRFLRTRTRIVETVDPVTTWRTVRGR